MFFRKNHRGSFLCLSVLILGFLTFATFTQGCSGRTPAPDPSGTAVTGKSGGSENCHTITANDTQYYVLDRAYTGEFDL